jgi:hypothetical protein
MVLLFAAPRDRIRDLSRDVLGVYDQTHTIYDYLSCFA